MPRFLHPCLPRGLDLGLDDVTCKYPDYDDDYDTNQYEKVRQ